MNRKVLLIEPNYRNKYPPLSLMKLATYHRMIGDEVIFFKGTDVDFAINETMKLLIRTLKNNDPSVQWNHHWQSIVEYLKKGGEKRLNTLWELSFNPLVKRNLQAYRKYYHNKEYLNNPQWDRVCITTLFTFYWAKTVEAINYYKQFCKDQSQVFVGGISASVVPDEMEKETGIKPIIGLLDKGGELDPEHENIIIEYLPLDYSILEEIEYIYPEHDGYYGYMTRGCVNHCAFCVVPKLEPTYQCHIPIRNRIEDTRKRFGEKRNLLLLDNNVLASDKLDAIIDEIELSGFYKGAKYVAPNYYEIAINNIKDGYNIPAHLKSLVKQYKRLYEKTKVESEKQLVCQKIEENYLDNIHTITEDKVLETYDFFKDRFEKIYNNKPKIRYVDFNQGIDSRLINEDNIKKIARIPVRPLRIAFDHWELRDKYVRSIELAAEYGITHLSNYLLYNFKDKPIELWQRMKMNVDLCEKYNISVYSFPMKYHPITDPQYFRNRLYLGEYWNRKFIRAIQAVLNATKGKIGRGKSFFEEAFGKNEQEFNKLLYMPETMIIYRFFYKKNHMVDEWYNAYQKLSSMKLKQLQEIVGANEFDNIESLTSDNEILNVLRYYTISRDDAEKKMQENCMLK